MTNIFCKTTIIEPATCVLYAPFTVMVFLIIFGEREMYTATTLL